jgi:hypothetical protein
MLRLFLLILLFVGSAAKAEDPVLVLNPQGDDQHPCLRPGYCHRLSRR